MCQKTMRCAGIKACIAALRIVTAMKGDPMNALWHQGWYRFAQHTPSPNFGPRPANTSIDLVVLHSISLPPGQYGTPHVAELFTNQLDWNAHPYFEQIRDTKVSAHFYIRRNGELWQFVSCDDRAWHAGASHYRGRDNCNDDSIGIELEGVPYKGTPQMAQEVAAGQLACAISPQANFAELIKGGRLRLLATTGAQRRAP